MTKTIFITGASSGFGQASAELFAEHGWQLILAARRVDRLEALAKKLKTKTHIIQLDVRDRDAVNSAFAQLPDDFKNIDVLLNNAGLALGREAAQLSDVDDWETMVDTNIKGLMYCTHAALQNMTAQNKGHIINIGSIAATNPYPGGHTYGASKAFVKQFSRNLRCDLLGTPIRVSLVEPGLTHTEFSLVRFKQDEQKEAAIYEGTTPLTAQDIANSVYWIVTQPAHVNICTVELMPTCQANGPMATHREPRKSS
jgi:3-hydroxy acid dehydrogenase/malonic semialdehyde reductase